MIINEDNVVDIPRADAPHALGLEQRILVQTSAITKQTPFWQRSIIPFLPMPVAGLLAASVVVFVLLTVLDVPYGNQVQQQATLAEKLVEPLNQTAQDELFEFVDEDDMYELMLLQDEHFFAQMQ